MKIKTEDDFTLDTIYNKIEGSKKGVILAHGMTVSKEDEEIFVRAESKLNKAGLNTIRFDFRAHGGSEGAPVKDFTVSGELKDLKAVFNFFEEKEINQVGLAGASFGGSISALYSGKHPDKVDALFLANPVLSYEKCFLSPTTSWGKENFESVFDNLKQRGFIEVGSKDFKMGEKIFEEIKSYHPCEELKNYQNPLLVAHGDKDTKVSCGDVINCFESLSNEQKSIEIIEGSDHGFHEEPYETKVVNLIINFFKDSLG